VIGYIGIIAYIAANMYPKASLMFPGKYKGELERNIPNAINAFLQT